MIPEVSNKLSFRENRDLSEPHLPHVAFFASRYPSHSETFVYREVAALRDTGFHVIVVSLRDSLDIVPDHNNGRESADMRVYGHEVWTNISATLLEWILHPFRACQTIIRAVADALWPEELTSPYQRAITMPQAFLSIGLANRLRRCGVKHIHCHFSHAPTTVGMYAAMHLRVPFSFVGHANDLFQRRKLLKKKLQRAAFVSCISLWHKQFYSDIELSVISRCRIIRCGVDIATWRPQQEPKAIQGPFTILTVGRLIEKKGIDMLIRAVACLPPETQKRLRLIIVGDGPMRGPWQQLAVESGVSEWIDWQGARENQHVRDLMLNADLFVLPCRVDDHGDRDGIPVVLIEAMACGVPVIAGDIPSIRELVEDGVNGRIVERNTPRALSDLIRDLMCDSQSRHRLGAAGRFRVVSEFSLHVNVERLKYAILNIGLQ